METLKPVEISEYYIKRIASGMSQYFWNNIFKGIFDILKDNGIQNSKNDLLEAIRSGRVWYEDGAFRSKRFSNKVSKALEDMGAIYKRNAYYIDRRKIPMEIRNLIDFVKADAIRKGLSVENYMAGLMTVLSKLTAEDLIKISALQMFKKLELDILKSAQEKKLPVIELDITQVNINVSRAKRKEIEQYWKQGDAQAKKIRDQIEATQDAEKKQELREKLKLHQRKTFENAPTLDIKLDEYKLNKTSEKLANDYVYNMNYWIKKWEAKDIIKMRQEVSEMVQRGARIPELQAYFEKHWKQAKDKAYFLATNESHLAGSVIQATQYQELGCTHFLWGRSASKEKRLSHLELAKTKDNKYGINGKNLFSFDNPPVIDDKLGIRGLPRQIWNCKCFMIPVPPSLPEILKKKDEVQNAKRNIVKFIQYKIRNNKQRNHNAWRYRRYGEG